jgi:hypothetical protein
MPRDAQMQGLAHLVNRIPLDVIPESGASTHLVAEFVKWLTPWITGEPSRPLGVVQRPRPLRVDCQQKMYSHALTGRQLAEPIMVVDLVPFGFDIDLLEAHLLEIYDVVDVIILFEAPWTHQGVDKAMYFAESHQRTPERWQRFMDKLLIMQPSTKTLTAAQRSAAGADNGRSWDLENSMRTEPLQQLKTSTHPLAVKLRQHLDTAMILQHDGDEIPSASAVLHLKSCELKPSTDYYFPCTSYKLNTQWLQTTFDRVGWGQRWADSGLAPSNELGRHLWAPGPGAQKLSLALETLSLRRYQMQHETPNFGPGAAVHISSSAEPVACWLRWIGHVEAHVQALPDSLLRATRERSVTPAMLSALADPWCSSDYLAVHVSTTKLVGFLHEHLPWALTSNPERYPFTMPSADTLHCSYHEGKNTCAWSAAGPAAERPAICERFIKTATP